MIESDWRRRLSDLFIGVVGSLIASVLLLFAPKVWQYPIVLFTAAFALNFGLFLYYRFHYQSAASKLSTLKALTGIGRIDNSLREGETPEKCMGRATSSLKFMGIGAQKWSVHEQELRHMLSRLRRVRGSARFLVIEPTSQWAKEASVQSGHKPDWLRERLVVSLRQFKVLREYFDNLEVRLYNHYPYYRLVLINDQVAIVGQYRGVDSGTGWDAPLVHFEAGTTWSFYQGYHVHFEGEWEQARPVDWDALD